MAQQVKHRAAKKDDPSSIPQDLRDRERERELTPTSCFLTSA